MWVLLIVLVLAVAVVLIVTSPWRRSSGPAQNQAQTRVQEAAAEVLDLEAARDAKYREIRDAELDRSTGHLSDADFASVDAGLRAEAIEILRRLDRARARLAKLQAGDPEQSGDDELPSTPA